MLKRRGEIVKEVVAGERFIVEFDVYFRNGERIKEDMNINFECKIDSTEVKVFKEGFKCVVEVLESIGVKKQIELLASV